MSFEIPTRAQIVEDLQNQEVIFSFEKKDGDIRHMRATLAKSLIPEDKMPKNFDSISSEEIVRCFDLDINEWRSFRINSLKFWGTIEESSAEDLEVAGI